MEEFLRSLHLIAGVEQLLDNIAAKLVEILDTKAVAIVLFEPITGRYVGKKSKGTDADVMNLLNFSPSDHLVRWLNINQCPLDIVHQQEVVRFLSTREQDVVQRIDCILVVPLIVINRLTGMIFLGRVRSGEGYDEAILDLLSRLADQSALAIEHASLIRFQEERLKRLFHSDKLATVGELAAGVAHEIRNPLTSIRSTVQFVQKDLSGEKRLLVDGIIEEVDRIDRIINDLLSFSRSSELSLDRIDVEEAMDQTLQLMESEFRKQGITVERDSDHPPLTISADVSQLKQVFINVMMNSIQAMPDGGAITISTGLHSGGDPSARFLSVTIRDTGPGIATQDLPKVFDPFYTTKETGTGLGLSISYGIVSKHGGDIEIESRMEGTNTGTTVIIRLPVAE